MMRTENISFNLFIDSILADREWKDFMLQPFIAMNFLLDKSFI